MSPISKGPAKQLRICPKCGGYMMPQAPFAGRAKAPGWHHDSQQRSFGGVNIEHFMCESCGHAETFQTDRCAHLKEDL